MGFWPAWYWSDGVGDGMEMIRFVPETNNEIFMSFSYSFSIKNIK